MLPDDQLQVILGLSGEQVAMTFANEEHETVTEQVIPTAITSTVTRFTDPQGNVIWKGIGLQIRFIEAHTPEE